MLEPAMSPYQRNFFSSSLLLPMLTILLLLAATVVGYYGTRTNSLAVTEVVSTDEISSDTSDPSAWLHEAPALPSGPQRECFQSSCTACHSTRLVLTQPSFSEGKWKEVVHKMVAVYGAPLSPE